MFGFLKNLRRLFYSVSLLLCTLLLTSCFEVKQDVSVNNDGSGKAKIEFAVEKAFAPEIIPQIKKTTVPSGWRIVGEQEKDGKLVLMMERMFQNMSELSDNEMRYSFSSEKTGFVKRAYSIDITMLKTSEMPFPYTLTLKVPGGIEDTNGNKISSDTVQWDLQGLQKGTILSIKSKGMVFSNSLALLLLILPIVIVLMILIFLKRKRVSIESVVVAQRQFCVHCGERIPEDSDFCVDCGAKIS